MNKKEKVYFFKKICIFKKLEKYLYKYIKYENYNVKKS